MNGGTITNNKTDEHGGGVYVGGLYGTGGTFNLNTPRGSIASNTATSGGPQVYVATRGIFNDNGTAGSPGTGSY
jgi:hypothetical protein